MTSPSPAVPPCRPADQADRLLAAATLALLVWLPLPLGSNRDWAAGGLILLTGLLGLAWALARLRRPAPLAPAQRTALPLLGLLLLPQLWVAVQLLAERSADRGATLQSLLLGLAYGLLFWLVVSLFHTRRRLTVLLWTLVLSGTLQAFWGTAMTLSRTEWLLLTPKSCCWGDATGTFVNRNHLAGYLEMTLACGIGLLLALREGRPFRWQAAPALLLGPKARLRLALVIMVIGLVMTHSRMGNAAFLASLLGTGLLLARAEKEQRRRHAWLLASLLLVDVLVVGQFFGLDTLKQRLLQGPAAALAGAPRAEELRWPVLRAALPLLAERPLTGHGAGSFETVFARRAGPDIPLHFDHAHNDYLEFLVDFGLIGSLPLALFVLRALQLALAALRQRRSVYRSGVGFAAVMGILALLLHALADFNLQIPANAATLVTLCALAVLAGGHSSPRRPGAPVQPGDAGAAAVPRAVSTK